MNRRIGVADSGKHTVRFMFALALLAFTACGGRGERDSTEKHPRVVLVMAHSTTGDPEKAELDRTVAEFEALHPDIAIKQNAIETNIYETIGLKSLFSGGTPPDIYSQWGKYLVGEYQEAGYAADLTDEIEKDNWKDRFDPSVWVSATYKGRIYLIPTSIDLTSVIWYNKTIFRQNGLEPPTTWTEFMTICDTLKNNGIVPVCFGNKDLWPAANWAAHLVSRVAGEQLYDDVLSMKPGAKFANDGFIKGLGMIETMARSGYFNPGLNGVSDMEAIMLFFQGRVAMHPIGGWIINHAKKAAPEGFEYDAFKMPAIEDGAGDQTSILRLASGYMVYRDTKHFDEAVAFLRYLTSVDVAKRFVSRCGTFSSVHSAITEETADPHLLTLVAMHRSAHTVVTAPDVGYDRAKVLPFMDAVALVIGGQKSAREALEQCDRAVAALR
jgi:raffinose/stachyose/melibiose transport system substrate-binding protein